MDFKQYLILDLETTGIDLFKDRIVKLTTISFSDETVSDTQIKSRLFNPKISIILYEIFLLRYIYMFTYIYNVYIYL